MSIGLAVIVGGSDSRPWAIVLVAAGVFYGLFGAIYLGVAIDWVLAAGALSLLIETLQKRSAVNA